MTSVIIPLTGYGSRFKEAGYKDLKPFIKVFGKTMLEWIVSMYDVNDTHFYFITRGITEATEENKDYFKEYNKIIFNLAPHQTVINIRNWKKLGPAYDIFNVRDTLKEQIKGSVIVNYCDFFALWNSQEFLQEAKLRDYDGAIPCYTGFHPHLIPKKNVYASCKIDSHHNLVKIKEKHVFDSKYTDHNSPGIYYFRDINIMLTAISRMIWNNDKLNGEYYLSIVYKYMIDNPEYKVWVPDNIKYFCQWGTPYDLEEFVDWIKVLGGHSK